MPFGPEESRLNAIEHKLTDVAGALRQASRRLIALEESIRQDTSLLDIYSGLGVDLHTLNVYGSCWTNPAIDDADVYVYAPQPDPAHPGSTILAFVYSTRTVGGYVLLSVPRSPAAGGALAYCKVVKQKYAVATVTLDPAGPHDHAVVLKPATRYEVAPAVRVTQATGASGAGAQLVAAISGTGGLAISNAPGTYGGDGYDPTPRTGIALSGGNDTGAAAEARVGQLASVTASGTAAPNTSFDFTFLPAGRSASIRGTIASGGATTWAIDDSGDGYAGTPTITAQSAGVNWRTARIAASISGGTISAIAVRDPGYYNLTAGSTIGATISGGRGEGAQIRVTTDGAGNRSGIILATGSEYYLAPTNLSQTGGGTGTPASVEGVAATFNRGIGATVLTRGGDRYGCFGTSPDPVKLTGRLSHADLGSIDLLDRNWFYALGNLYDTSTIVPNIIRTGYYRFFWGWYRGGYLQFTTTFSGGSLTAVNVVDSGYGYLGSSLYFTATPGSTVGGQGSGYGGTMTGTDYAVFHFPLDPNGSCGAPVIDHAGSGYGASGTQAGWVGPEPQGGEWELICSCLTRSDQGPTWPSSTDAQVAWPDLFQVYGEQRSSSAFWPVAPAHRRRASSYSLNPFAATYDFTGMSGIDGVVFQGTLSRVVTYSE